MKCKGQVEGISPSMMRSWFSTNVCFLYINVSQVDSHLTVALSQIDRSLINCIVGFA